MEFLRRYLQHVLPTGFMKIRHYGFLSPCASLPLEKVRTMIEVALGLTAIVKKSRAEPFAPIYCPRTQAIPARFSSQ
ncbi:MAG: transposase [Desulfobacterales bacterium]|nr:transposase [Desulfobacterales bacterium]MDD4073814.1 transposase [Desulfobacterales bacterium]MDD4392914.1 transposase [Desulfobacterales bacterium]